MKTFLLASVFTLLKITFLPDLDLIFWLFLAMLLDLVTGIGKRYVLKEARTSSGYRATVQKLIQYGSAIIITMIVCNVAEKHSSKIASTVSTVCNTGVIIYFIFIEIASIFENLFAINPKGPFSKYFVKPMLNILTFQLKNNPATQFKIDEETTDKNNSI